MNARKPEPAIALDARVPCVVGFTNLMTADSFPASPGLTNASAGIFQPVGRASTDADLDARGHPLAYTA